MGVKHGFPYSGNHTDCGRLRRGCCGEYLGLILMKNNLTIFHNEEIHKLYYPT
jgi:hypothetical protein